MSVNFNELAREIHADNVAAGWWTDLTTGESLIGKRNIGELLCLVHSEISEAWDAHCTGSMDDKLPHRNGVEVELADAAIRLFDITGAYQFDIREEAHRAAAIHIRKVEGIGTEGPMGSTSFRLRIPRSEVFSDIHSRISRTMEHFRKGRTADAEKSTGGLIGNIFGFSDALGFNIMEAIAEKREYNRNRADHKPENRAKTDGKKF